MTPPDLYLRAAAMLWGVALGLFYFGGLWWTLKGLPRRRNSKSWLGLSFAIRTLVLLAGLWLVLQRDVPAFFLALLGFFLTRLLMTRAIMRKA